MLFISKKKQAKKNDKTQSGRSMAEMIGVLAIIGILTIGGITGIRYSLQVRSENQTVNDFSLAVAGAKTLGLEFAESGFVNIKNVVSVPERSMKGDYFITDSGSPISVHVEDSGYTVRIAGISKLVCEQIRYGKYGETCAMIGSEFNLGTCQEKIDDVDCDLFGSEERKSQIQIDGVSDISYSEAEKNYQALMLYFDPINVDLDTTDDNDDTGSDSDSDSGSGSGDDTSTGGDDEDDLGGYINGSYGFKNCYRYTPFLKDDEGFKLDVSLGTEVKKCCTSARGTWIDKTAEGGEAVCCTDHRKRAAIYDSDKEQGIIIKNAKIGKRFFRESPTDPGDKKECCDLVSDLNKDQFCCEAQKNPKRKYQKANGTAACCELDGAGNLTGNDSNGNLNCTCIKCPDNSISVDVGGACCCGATDVNGYPKQKCCDSIAAYIWQNSQCCELDSAGKLTGKDYKGNTDTNCKKCNSKCSDGSEAKNVNGTCCCGATDAKGNPNQVCCDDVGGDWHNSVCCQSPCAWNYGAEACCDNNKKCPDGKKADENLTCTPSCADGEQTVKTTIGGDNVVVCCEPDSALGYISTDLSKSKTYYSVCCTNNTNAVEYNGTCCKQSASYDFVVKGSSQTCCQKAGGIWMGSYCCASGWRVVGAGGGMCHKPGS